MSKFAYEYIIATYFLDEKAFTILSYVFAP